MATLRQKRAVEAVVSGSNLTNAMKIANYSESTAKRTNKLTRTKGYQELMLPIIKQLEHQRQLALNRAEKTVDKAQYRHVIEAIDKFTKQIQLLNGDATENQVININVDGTLANRYALNPSPTTDSK